MCCLFGLIDTRNQFTGKQKTKILQALCKSGEIRGTDATGIAFNTNAGLCVCKAPVPGHALRFHVRNDTVAAVGHTRLATQGDAKKAQNAHPFLGHVGSAPFALAHNGMLSNDRELRRKLKLPVTDIETDSYVATQIIEQQGVLSFDSLRYMAEQMDGTFTFTVLDWQSNVYFIKGNSPLCLYHYRHSGLILYASTEEVLTTALLCIPYRLGKATPIKVTCGEILKITPTGKQERAEFDDSKLFASHWPPYAGWPNFSLTKTSQKPSNTQYMDDLKSIASFFGYSPSYVDYLLAEGIDPEEIEDMIYEGERGGFYESPYRFSWH